MVDLPSNILNEQRVVPSTPRFFPKNSVGSEIINIIVLLLH